MCIHNIYILYTFFVTNDTVLYTPCNNAVRARKIKRVIESKTFRRYEVCTLRSVHVGYVWEAILRYCIADWNVHPLCTNARAPRHISSVTSYTAKVTWSYTRTHIHIYINYIHHVLRSDVLKLSGSTRLPNTYNYIYIYVTYRFSFETALWGCIHRLPPPSNRKPHAIRTRGRK